MPLPSGHARCRNGPWGPGIGWVAPSGDWGIVNVYPQQTLDILEQFGAGDRLLPRQWGAVANACGAAAGAHAGTNTAPAPTPPALRRRPRHRRRRPEREAPQPPTITRPARHRDGAAATAPPAPARPAPAAPARVTPPPAAHRRLRRPQRRARRPSPTRRSAPSPAARSSRRRRRTSATCSSRSPAPPSSTFAPGASRPILRGLSDFRVRIQENGVGTADVSDLSQDHARADRSAGDPEDRNLSRPRGAALRHAGGRRHRRGDQQPHPDDGAVRRRRGRVEGRPQQRQQRLGERAAARRRLAQRRDPCRHFRPPRRRLPHPELSVPVPAGSRAGGERPAAELVAHAPRAHRAGGSWLFDGGYAGAAVTASPPTITSPASSGRATRTHIRLEQTKITSKGEFRRALAAICGRPLLGRLHRLQARRDRTQRHRLRADRRHLPQPREGGQGRGRTMPMFDAVRRLDQHLRRAGQPSAARHLGRGAAVSGPHQGRRRLLVQRDCAHADRCARSSRAASRTSRSTAPRSIFRRTSCRRRTIRTGSARSVNFAPKSVELQRCSRTCRHSWWRA